MRNGSRQTFVRLKSTNGQWLVNPKLRGRIVADAKNAGSNLTEVVVLILAGRYKVRIPDDATSGVRTAPHKIGDVLKIDLPPSVHKAVCIAAARSNRRPMDELRVALCEHYELAMPKHLAAAR